MSKEEKGIWDKLPETTNTTVLGNSKSSHKPSTHANFRDVTLGGAIKSSYYQFDFGDTPNETSNNYPIEQEHHNDNDGDNYMIPTNIYNTDNIYTIDIRRVITSLNPYSTQETKCINIDGKQYHQVNT